MLRQRVCKRVDRGQAINNDNKNKNNKRNSVSGGAETAWCFFAAIDRAVRLGMCNLQPWSTQMRLDALMNRLFLFFLLPLSNAPSLPCAASPLLRMG
jgi:hypothetical protein